MHTWSLEDLWSTGKTDMHATGTANEAVRKKKTCFQRAGIIFFLSVDGKIPCIAEGKVQLWANGPARQKFDINSVGKFWKAADKSCRN